MTTTTTPFSSNMDVVDSDLPSLTLKPDDRRVFDLDYTDRPFLYCPKTGACEPSNGFKRYSNSYTVGDVWESDSVMEEYAVSTSTVMRLKNCFERMNRKTKKNKSTISKTKSILKKSNYSNNNPTGAKSSIHDRLKRLFNKKYMKLLQMVVSTNYRYNMRKFIVTPPITQSTYLYDSMLSYLCRLDNMSPNELQKQRVKRNNDIVHIRGNANSQKKNSNNLIISSNEPARHSFMDNAALQRVWKDFMTVELVNKSIKDQTQGGKSFLKQVVLAGKHFNSCYGKVLPDPTLAPDEIGIPACIMETQMRGSEMNQTVVILKRDPVFSSDAITLALRVKRNPYPYITLPSEIITQKQLDFDGDNVTLYIMVSPNCFIEAIMRVSSKISMYCYFSRTRLTFSQTNGFRIHGLLQHIKEEEEKEEESEGKKCVNGIKSARIIESLGHTFEFCHRVTHVDSNVSNKLFETLLSISQQYGPFVAYGYVMSVRNASFKGYNHLRIYPIGPKPKEMALHIADSGSKGSKDSVNKMFESNLNSADGSLVTDTIEYAKLFIEAKNIIKKQGHNAKKMDAAFQNVIVDYNDNLVIKVNMKIYNLGHVCNYIQRDWVFSNLTTRTIIESVDEDESVMINRCYNLVNYVGNDNMGMGSNTIEEDRTDRIVEVISNFIVCPSCSL